MDALDVIRGKRLIFYLPKCDVTRRSALLHENGGLKNHHPVRRPQKSQDADRFYPPMTGEERDPLIGSPHLLALVEVA